MTTPSQMPQQGKPSRPDHKDVRRLANEIVAKVAREILDADDFDCPDSHAAKLLPEFTKLLAATARYSENSLESYKTHLAVKAANGYETAVA